MNKVMLTGRLARDPEVRDTQGAEPVKVARFTLAVDRQVTKGNSGETADFISCIAWRKSAELTEKYLRKGMKVLVEGRIQTGSYTNKDNQKVYTTDVVVERIEFLEKKSDSAEPADSSFIDQGIGSIADEIPFN